MLKNGKHSATRFNSTALFRSLIVFMLLQMCVSVNGQIPAPELICVSKDTILWNLPDVTCGEVDVYEIYYSTDINEPFEYLVTIINPTQSHYWHQNSSGETRYYYMKTKADCPGQISEVSDTINNIPPPKIPINRVTVDEDNVRIEWERSDNDKVHAYVIYKSTSTGTIPIDTVYNASAYIDTEVDVYSKSEYYYVLSLDECMNPSLFDIVHRTIFAEAEVDSCSRAITLTWNPYEGWGDELVEYGVYEVDKSDGTEELLGTVEPAAPEFTVNDVRDAQEYCYEIRARHSDGRVSYSQKLCITPSIARPVRYAHIFKADVQLDGDVEVGWEWNADAQLADAFLRGELGGNVNEIPFAGINPIAAMETLIDEVTNPSAGPIQYTINSYDVCDTSYRSDPVSTIYLSVEDTPDFTVEMWWTAMEVEKRSGIEYFMERTVQNQVVEKLPIGSGDLSAFTFAFDQNDMEIYESCYRVGADFYYEGEGGARRKVTMHSNVACPEFDIRVQVPNALVYQGVNAEFKPLFLTPNLIEKYSMEIFSRNGQQVFSTQDVNVGWDGTADGKILPQGVYVYKITAEKGSDKKDLRGMVNLLH